MKEYKGDKQKITVFFNPPGTYPKKSQKLFDDYFDDAAQMGRCKAPMTTQKCEKSGGHSFRPYCQLPGWMEYGCEKCGAQLRLPNEIW